MRILVGIFTAALACLSVSAGAEQGKLVGLYDVIPYHGAGGIRPDSAGASATIPMSTFSITASKDKKTYTETIVGGSPFAAKPGRTSVDVVIVPIIVVIGAQRFDPTVNRYCASEPASPVDLMRSSPLFDGFVFDGRQAPGHASLIDGVDMGKTTYPDAFRRAEFWNVVGSTPYRTTFKVATAPAWTIPTATVKGFGPVKVIESRCSVLAVINQRGFQNYLENVVIPGTPMIKPTTLAFFVLSNLVTTQSKTDCSQGCVLGFHSAFGSPAQTYAVADFDRTQGLWAKPISDISVASHEFAEWMGDPLGANPTPAWGGIGQVSGCQDNWENGDPLTGTSFPVIKTANGATYHLQELAFESWFFNAKTDPSGAAGGKFSTNGRFHGPSGRCPHGGTY